MVRIGKPKKKSVNTILGVILLGSVLFLSMIHAKLGKNFEEEFKATTSSTSTSSSSSATSSECKLEGSFTPPSDIIIDYTKIRSIDKTALEHVSPHTVPAYVKHMLKDAGQEHYPFLHYISSTYGDCRHFMDIGTRYVASSLALGSNLHTPVWTFDIPTSKERVKAFRGKSESKWQASVKETGVDVKFHNLDLMKVSEEELKRYAGTWFIMLDTFHEPDTVPFEREFFERLIQIEYKGLLALDDIHLNSEMKKWWKEVVDGAEKHGYKTYDLTEVGHFSGTGLVDFSGKVTIKKE